MKTIKKIMKYFLTFMAPWISMLIIGENIAAAITFIMQVTVIGWIPAGIWACSLLKTYLEKQAQAQAQSEPKS